jgi:hypothetical protein
LSVAWGAAKRRGSVRTFETPSWPFDSAAYVAIVAILAIAAATFTHYGVSWDEGEHQAYGESVFRYYASWFTDRTAVTWKPLYQYGAAFDLSAVVLQQVLPFEPYQTRHLFNFLIGVVGLIGAWRLARLIAGPRAGFFAVLFLAATPNFYGHMFNNPKDIPFAVGTVWALYFAIRIVRELPAPPWHLILKLGLTIGLALGVRIGGLLLLAYFGLALAAWLLLESADRRPGPMIITALRIGVRVALPVALLAYAVMLVFWPWAQQAPLANPLVALAEFSHHAFPYKVLFLGDYVAADDLPWFYLPFHVLVNLPELTVIVLILGAPWAAMYFLRHRRWMNMSAVLPIALLVFAALFPLIYAIVIKAIVFNGMRHFLFVVPPLCVLAAITVDGVLDRLKEVRWRGAVTAALGAYVAWHVSTMVALHPYQYLYYNEFVGGLEGAQGELETDYWANTYAEAVEELVGYLSAAYGPTFEKRKFRIAVCGPPTAATANFPANFEWVEDIADADYFIAFTKDNCDEMIESRDIVRIERLDVTLAVVKDCKVLRHALIPQ